MIDPAQKDPESAPRPPSAEVTSGAYAAGVWVSDPDGSQLNLCAVKHPSGPYLAMYGPRGTQKGMPLVVISRDGIQLRRKHAHNEADYINWEDLLGAVQAWKASLPVESAKLAE